MRWLCNDCDWVGSDVKIAPHPFTDGTIRGCQKCGGIELFEMCEVDKCCEVASCGTPTQNNYIRCCGKHFDEIQKESAK